jgi:predicted CoA-substrate-specific enzyme activase
MEDKLRYIGLDAGSVSVKAVVINDGGDISEVSYERHRGYPLTTALDVLQKISLAGDSISITGASGKLIAEVLGTAHTNEIASQSYAARKFYPTVNTIIEMGGEDSKLIIMEEGQGIRDFSMNSVCAAGTGSFLDQQAERMRLSIEEFSALAVQAKSVPRIAGRCSVFAKSDMIHLQQIATPVEDIVAGLCFAVARNFKGSIVKGRAILPLISFQGGVALNKGMVRAFKEIFELDVLVVPGDDDSSHPALRDVRYACAMMGAVGAVLKDRDEGRTQTFELKKLELHIRDARHSDKGRKPLVIQGDRFFERHDVTPAVLDTDHAAARISLASASSSASSSAKAHGGDVKKPAVRAYLGIDIGSISTNLAIIDDEGNLIARRYLMTASRPIEAVMEGLRQIGEETLGLVDIAGVATTGSGRYMIADFVGADVVKNEITAQATAAISINKNVDTIFEIGGQDSKYIAIEDGVIVDFEMNKACAAGTGSFLEEQAEKLDISIKEEFAGCAFSSEHPSCLGERCTVFMENSLMANLQKGTQKNDLLAGLAYSIVENYINRVVAGKSIGKNIFFQGGTAHNKAVVAAFEKYIGREITVPPNHDVTGAIGMALIARDHHIATGHATRFKGFSISDRSYKVTSFECKSCSNVCEINRVSIEGETGFLFYGGRCEKYDLEKKGAVKVEDLFTFREKLLFREYDDIGDEMAQAPAVGVPYVFLMQEYLPFCTVLLRELGIRPVLSPRTNRQVVTMGVETVLSESCFPVKVAHGHIKHFIEAGINTVLLPSAVNMARKDEDFIKGSPCPYTQTIPYMAGAAFPGLNILKPVIDLSRGEDFLVKQIKEALSQFNVTTPRVAAALKKALNAQEEFLIELHEKGQEVLSAITEKTIVIVGRAYNSFDPGINLQIPKKLSALKILSMPMDMLPLASIDIRDRWSEMYWRSGQRILKAARFIKDHPLLYPIYIGNFNCGPDSFILKFFKEELGEKPFLHLEIDEHSADAGAVTRCEAFLDSIGNRRSRPLKVLKPSKPLKNLANVNKVYIPRMSDHAFALAAALEYAGKTAEVLPESDRDSIALARKHVSGKECYPCVVTTGDMLKKLAAPDFDIERSVFFMPSGTGPCRFGQYSVFQRLVLEKIGYEDVPIFSPVQDTSFYKDLGIAGTDFIKRSWQGIIAIELLTKCLHETRPFEAEPGATDLLYDKHLTALYDTLRVKGGDVNAALKLVRKDFQALPRLKILKPVIGVIGEIFVRSSRFSNEDLVRRIERLGGVAWLAPVEEWIYYVNYFSFKHALLNKDYFGIIDIFIKRLYKKNVEHKYQRHFKGFLKTMKEPDTKELLKNAAKYVHESFEGETVLSIGKSVDLAERGVAGIVNAMPFGCMPGTIVTALMRAVSRDYGVPSISIPYDGAESGSTVLQLEAFMEQAKSRVQGLNQGLS